MKLAFVFPGQGSQVVGMGRAFFEDEPLARAVFDEADEALGFPLSKVILEGPEEELRRTEITQPAILTASVAMARVLEAKLDGTGLKPAMLAGHSLGEYTAHVVAGTFPFAAAVKAVRFRGKYMQEAVPEGEGAMAAILGLESDQISDICNRVSDELTERHAAEVEQPQQKDDSAAMAEAHGDAPLAESASSQSVLSDTTNMAESIAQAALANSSLVMPANLNAPEQTVISGAKAAVERAVELCKEAGAKRTVMLQVSAPFHCSLMRPAQERLATDLERMAFADSAVPVVANVDARCVQRASDARDCLIRQVTGAVRWVECMRVLLDEGVTHVVEIGPGRVLSGLMRQIDRSATMLNVEDPQSLEKTLAALTAAGA